MVTRDYILIFALLSTPLFAHARTITCEAHGGPLAPKLISWDTDTHVAHLELGRLYTGSVTLTRKFNDGYKVNMVFPNVLYQSELEYIVFPLSHGGGTFRVIGVGYEVIDGKRYLTTGFGEYNASCKS